VLKELASTQQRCQQQQQQHPPLVCAAAQRAGVTAWGSQQQGADWDAALQACGAPQELLQLHAALLPAYCTHRLQRLLQQQGLTPCQLHLQ
jgi:hypothetical protein